MKERTKEERRKHYEENIKRERFYSSKRWKRFRDAYFQEVYACEECKEKGIVTKGENLHHIVHLNEQNVDNFEISLNRDNVILLCYDCHNLAHNRDYLTRTEKSKEKNEEKRKEKMRYEFDSEGNIIDKK